MTSAAQRIHENPDLLRFIPDERFKGSLRASIAGSMRGTAPMTGLIQAGTRNGLIHMWTWHAAAADFNARRIAVMARRVAGRGFRIERTQDRESFLTVADNAGYATHTIYRKVPK